MVSCLMGDSTALASAIVRCCPKIFTDLLRESRAFLTVSAAEYGAGHNAAEVFRILPDSMLGVLVCHCETVSCAGGLLHLYGGGQLFARNTKDNKPFSELLFLGDLADGGLFAVSRIDTAVAKRGEMLFLSPGALNFEPMGIDTAEFIRWALESREETLKGVWLTGEILSPRALKKHITAKLDLLDRLDMLKTEGDA